MLTKHKVPIRSKKYKGRTYVVSEDPSVHVRVYGKGKEIMSACVASDPDFPEGDQKLNEIMANKTDEDDYLKRSNVSNDY